ncbi:ATP synthase E chain-domain-containing protein [Crucibulum laeve]|uniref:ATP synthase F(0) complex subunit e, mitochondrial n=1 Tax=Crucibulum laeve TaxID=68775 RepID=A0A5C3MDV1_9AGAR|nr:ATP synthase E chain-domain-containing protein [Crucibulum laeve]
MVSSTVNVVRYSALVSGIAYGWYHRRTLQAAHTQHKVEQAVHDRERLVAEAKKAWKTKQEAVNDTTLVTDPEDPQFDLEKLIAKWEKSS